jgi:hypothetical protein
MSGEVDDKFTVQKIMSDEAHFKFRGCQHTADSSEQFPQQYLHSEYVTAVWHFLGWMHLLIQKPLKTVKMTD